MTIPEHIEILRRGPRIWNAWRAENPAIVPDLAGIALSIGDRQLGPINGGPINLSRALLNEATLYFATLTGADMRGTDLTNADLRGARLEGVDLTGADLAGAQLDGASLAGAVLKAANLSGASLADVRDLTSDQIGEAEGNLGTVLPHELERPALWAVGQGAVHIETAYDAAQAQYQAQQQDHEYEAAEQYEQPVHEERAYEDTAYEQQPPTPSFYAEPEVANGETFDEIVEDETRAYSGAETGQEAVSDDPEAAYEAAQPEEVAEPRPVVQEPQPRYEHAADPASFTPAPTLPRFEVTEPERHANQSPAPQTAPQSPAQPQPTAQPMPMRASNGEANGYNGNAQEPHANGHDGDENKHVSWLVGGPRRAGRPARNWRDRA